MTALKKIVLVWLIIILLFFLVFAQDNSQTVKKEEPLSPAVILDNCIQASGGSALAALKSEIRKGSLLRGVTGKVPLETTAKASDKWLYSQTFAWGDQVSYGCDGTLAWVQDTKTVSPLSPRQRLDLQLLLDFQAPLNIRKYLPGLAVKGSEKVGDREATTLKASSLAGIEIELAFDKETGLLLRAGDIVFEDYRDVGGVKRPFKILLGKDDGEKHLRMQIQFSEIRHDLEVDDSLFQRPASALPIKEPPLFKPRTKVEIGIEALEACAGKYQHPDRPELIYTVTRQQNHLLLGRSDWLGQKVEIFPESDTDYFIEFLNQEFHFVKDTAGNVTHLEIGPDRALKAKRIE
jgi:hypothetical protein